MTSEVKAEAKAMSANELALERTDLAIRRTLMAADRSLMAWIRTGLSMISFGFTIYKILQGMVAKNLDMVANPRGAALFLIGLGIIALVIGVIEYRHTVRQMIPGTIVALRRPAFPIAVAMAAMGLFLFLGIIIRAL